MEEKPIPRQLFEFGSSDRLEGDKLWVRTFAASWIYRITRKASHSCSKEDMGYRSNPWLVLSCPSWNRNFNQRTIAFLELFGTIDRLATLRVRGRLHAGVDCVASWPSKFPAPVTMLLHRLAVTVLQVPKAALGLRWPLMHSCQDTRTYAPLLRGFQMR